MKKRMWSQGKMLMTLGFLGGQTLWISLVGCETAKVNGGVGQDQAPEAAQAEGSAKEPTNTEATAKPKSETAVDNGQRLRGAAVPDDGEVEKIIASDSGKASGVIYVTLNHLAKEGGGADELEIYRFGVTKALNSISTQPKINKLEPLDPGETVYRLKLSDFSLGENELRVILAAPGAQEGSKKVGNSIVVKGDWLVFAVTRPEVYDRVMRIPNSVGQLESQMRLGAKRISAEVGNNQSEVTFGRRTLERQDAGIPGEPGGYFWRSYDYAGFLVAGEFFFSLPNGLQGYMLSGFATQHRIDAQPFVATDANRPQDGIGRCVGGVQSCGYVINGESCMTCHENGVKSNKNFGNFKGGSKEEFEALLEKDAQRFATAISKMGFDSVGVEPIKKTLETFRSRVGTEDKRRGGSEVNPVAPAGGVFQR